MHGPDVIAIGPGLGFAHEAEVLRLVREATQPFVVDADALTMLAKQGITSFAGPRLLTPHPGEMARFGPTTTSRANQARSFASQHHVTLLLKGSRTVIASPDQPLRYNSTGSPGMASGGMGDVLSGLCAALIAQGMSTHDAASAGSWLLGRSAESAITQGHASQESLSATDVAAHLGTAFTDLKHGAW
jgi:NAD(P)H-hydrate epimerase